MPVSSVSSAKLIAAPLSRRRFIQGVAAVGGLAGVAGTMRPGTALAFAERMPALSGNLFDLTLGPSAVNITGRNATATAFNAALPGPILRWREGDTVTLRVTNRLAETTSVHWHGIISTANMDGVPGLSFGGIKPGETFVFRIPVRQRGTYWYHSHSMYQEQTGAYGPIVIEPRAGYPQHFDRDYVVQLSDWSDTRPARIVSNLKMQSDYYNFHQRTVGSFVAEARDKGLGATIADRLAWGRMRMDPTDIADVSGYTYTYLLNGTPPRANWTGLFRPGERVRLRFINSAAMTFFDVRIPGLAMTVVAADGNDVAPVTVDEFRIGVAEVYDVIVEPRDDRAYTIFAQSEDRTGFARGTLATRPGVTAPIPPMDPRPLRTMADMGMGNMGMGGMHAAGGGGMAGMDMSGRAMAGAGQEGHEAPPMDHGGMTGMAAGGAMSGMDHGGMGHGARAMGSPASPVPTPVVTSPTMGHPGGTGHVGRPGLTGNSGDALGARLDGSVEVDNVAMMPTNRLDQPGIGLENNGRRVLDYTDLRALRPSTDRRPPSHEVVLRLTGNMERYIWGFDGKKFSEAEPIHLRLGERTRFTLINDTMMEHPIHLHGMWSELENGHGDYRPFKHTVIVKPGGKLSYLTTPDVPGMWAFHCHLLYHMEMGMFRVVVVT